MIYDHQPEDLEEGDELPVIKVTIFLLILGAAAYYFTSQFLVAVEKPITVVENSQRGLTAVLPPGWDCYLVSDTLNCKKKEGHEQSKD